ncbi:MAG: hypothetical protein IJ419_08025 [Agathobacter sp.]|nr:hypothetical protein [Agathobacter sp.]
MNNTNENAISTALNSFPSAKDFADQVQKKRQAIRADDRAAADRWIVSTLLPRVNLTIASTSATHTPCSVSLSFEGSELTGHDMCTMQSRVKEFLVEKGYSDIKFDEKNLKFTIK